MQFQALYLFLRDWIQRNGAAFLGCGFVTVICDVAAPLTGCRFGVLRSVIEMFGEFRVPRRVFVYRGNDGKENFAL